MLKLTLLENANSFLREALQEAANAETTPSRWKFAILHLVQSIELALKERLRIEHPAFVFANLDQSEESAKGKVTVTLDQAVARLKRFSNVRISERDQKTLERAKNWRNEISHYEFQGNPTEIKACFAPLLGFLREFYRRHLNLALESVIPNSLWEEAMAVLDYYEELKFRALERINEESILPELVWICPKCGAHTFVAGKEFGCCYTCGYQTGVDECQGCGQLKFAASLDYFWDDEHEDSTDGYCSECTENFEKGILDQLGETY